MLSYDMHVFFGWPSNSTRFFDKHVLSLMNLLLMNLLLMNLLLMNLLLVNLLLMNLLLFSHSTLNYWGTASISLSMLHPELLGCSVLFYELCCTSVLLCRLGVLEFSNLDLLQSFVEPRDLNGNSLQTFLLASLDTLST